MTYEIINSGSDGNCIIVNKKIMLDCGVAYKKVKPYLKNIKLIFISHRHHDHFNISTLTKISYEYPNIKYIVGNDVATILNDRGVPAKNLLILDLGYWYMLKLCKVKLDYLYHDVPNYAIHLNISGCKLVYATDTSKIDHIKAKDYDFAFIESNYDTKEELEEKIKIAKEKGEYTHLIRVKDTHLSQLEALNWLQANNIVNYQFIHEHKEKIK